MGGGTGPSPIGSTSTTKTEHVVFGFRESFGARIDSNLFHALSGYVNLYVAATLLGHPHPLLIWLDNNKQAWHEEMLLGVFSRISSITDYGENVIAIGRFIIAPSGMNSPLLGDMQIWQHPCWRRIHIVSGLVSAIVQS